MIRASVTGRLASSPSSDHPAAGLVLPSVVGHKGRHTMPSEGSRRANLTTRGHRRGDATPGSGASPVPASRRRDLEGAGPTRPAPNSPSSPVRRSRRAGLLAEAELAPVGPEAVQD